MKYRDGRTPYRFDEQNESRADRAEAAIRIVSDCAAEDEAGAAFTDLSDTLASLHHFADRAGIDWAAVVDHAETAYVGDREDAPYLAHDADRFPGA